MDTSVWAIINKVCKPELWLLCSAHPIIVLYICMCFTFVYSGHMGMVEMAIFNIGRAIFLKVGKQELRFMCSACHLMVFNICVKFHENMSEI